MSCNVEYSVDKDLKILTRTFIGPVQMEDIIMSWKYVINNKIINPSYLGVVSDFRKADPEIGLDDLHNLENFLKENMMIFTNLRFAQIVDTPSVAYPMLFKNEFPYHQSRPFSTIEAATFWIRG